MKRQATAILLVLCVVGCKRSASLDVSKDTGGATTTVAADPALDQFEGRWGHDGEIYVLVERKLDGSGQISVRPAEPGWRARVYAASVEGGKLQYKQVNYHDEDPSSAFHGAVCKMVLEPVAGTNNQLRQSLSTLHLQAEPVILERIP